MTSLENIIAYGNEDALHETVRTDTSVFAGLKDQPEEAVKYAVELYASYRKQLSPVQNPEKFAMVNEKLGLLNEGRDVMTGTNCDFGKWCKPENTAGFIRFVAGCRELLRQPTKEEQYHWRENCSDTKMQIDDSYISQSISRIFVTGTSSSIAHCIYSRFNDNCAREQHAEYARFLLYAYATIFVSNRDELVRQWFYDRWVSHHHNALDAEVSLLKEVCCLGKYCIDTFRKEVSNVELMHAWVMKNDDKPEFSLLEQALTGLGWLKVLGELSRGGQRLFMKEYQRCLLYIMPAMWAIVRP